MVKLHAMEIPTTQRPQWVCECVYVCDYISFLCASPFIKCRNTFSHIFLIFAPCWRRLRFSEFYSDFCSHSLSPSLPLSLTFSLTNCNMHVNADVSNVSRHLAHCKFVLCVTTRHAGCSLSPSLSPTLTTQLYLYLYRLVIRLLILHFAVHAKFGRRWPKLSHSPSLCAGIRSS